MEGKARNQLARQLRLLRFVRGWSQEQLAERSGLHRTYISTLERAGTNVGLDNLERLARAFSITVQDLLTTPDHHLLARMLQPRRRRRG